MDPQARSSRAAASGTSKSSPPRPLSFTLLLLATVVATTAAGPTAGHAVLTDPPQRGILGGSAYAPGVSPVAGAPVDYFPHFPSGELGSAPGVGHESQKAAAGGMWTPFVPTISESVWRAGVCGDPLAGDGAGDHLRGGRYYGGARIGRTYPRGGTLSMTINVVAAHGGWVGLHVCDVAQCGGEVSVACFSGGHCTRLPRVPDGGACEAGTSGDCAPVDLAHPDRWYMPCPRTLTKPVTVGGGSTALFRLPPDLTCDHCVLHFYWVTANWCNPPGVVDYFEGPHAPQWTRTCTPAQGGFMPKLPACGGGGAHAFPEEYLRCADIAIDGAPVMVLSARTPL